MNKGLNVILVSNIRIYTLTLNLMNKGSNEQQRDLCLTSVSFKLNVYCYPCEQQSYLCLTSVSFKN